MLNNEAKDRYIAYRIEHGLPTQIADKAFKNCSFYEEKIDKDLYNFTIFEIKDMYQTMNIRSHGSLRNINSLLKQYTTWAINENLVKDAQNHYEEMRTRDYDDCINIIAIKKRLLTRQEIFYYIKVIENPTDQFVLLATFEGLSGIDYCELGQLTMRDFDYKHLTVKLCTGRTISISKELYYIAEESANTFFYVTSNGRRRNLYGDEDLVIKDTNAKGLEPFQKGRRIYTRLVRVFEQLGIADWMTINALIDSGKVAWIKQEMEKGATISDFIQRSDTPQKQNFYEHWGKPITYNFYERCQRYF